MRAYTRTYTYDKLGNVEQVSHAATGSNYNRNFSYNAGHNTLDAITIGGSTLQTFTYDNSGNQLTSGTTRKTIWNAANQLKAYCNQVGTAEPTVYAQYLYDAGGNRIKKLIRTQGGDYETVVYIDELFIYHQKDGEGEKNEISIKDNKSRIACIRVGDTFTGDFPESEYYILEDHLGSSAIRLKHTPGGTKIDREEFYPFGDSSLRTFDKKKYQYVGKEKDSESGLYYYGARYYAAWTCRFISVDPVASEYPFYTPYNYAGNKPINRIDIDGMQEGEQTTDVDSNQASSSSIQSSDKTENYTLPNGQEIQITGLSNERYNGEVSKVNTTKIDENGNNIQVEVAKNSLLEFDHEGEHYTARFDEKTKEFNRYANQAGETFPLSEEKKEYAVPIEMTWVGINEDGILSGWVHILDDKSTLFSGKSFIFKAHMKGLDSDKLLEYDQISLSGSFNGSFKGTMFLNSDVEDLTKSLQDLEISFTEMSYSYSPMPYVGISPGFSTIKASKNFKTKFYGMNYSISKSMGVSLLPGEGKVLKSDSSSVRFDTEPTKEDSLRHNL